MNRDMQKVGRLVAVSRIVRAAGTTIVRNKQFFRHRYVLYTTERIVEQRSGKHRNQLPKTLYDASNEKDNCGVGLIASLKSVPSRSVVERADEMLVRMAHRGGCGCDPASGDGSGQCGVYFFCYSLVVKNF
jgi:Glutamine amidotransferases class-II